MWGGGGEFRIPNPSSPKPLAFGLHPKPRHPETAEILRSARLPAWGGGGGKERDLGGGTPTRDFRVQRVLGNTVLGTMEGGSIGLGNVSRLFAS